MTTIKNTNDAYGMPVEFSGATLEEAVADMQATIRECGPDFADVVVTPDDYEVVPTSQQIDLDHAVLTSITQTCCPDVDVDDTDAALAYLAAQHGLTDSVEMRGYTDCWGTDDDGDAWRLQLFPAAE